jgi:hypothetical protein
MSTKDHDKESVEELIIRSLDGELSEEEEVRLDRAVLRDPEARRLRDEYERTDALASAALNEALPEEAPSFDPFALTTRANRHDAVSAGRARGSHWTWWLMPGAVAAAIVAVLVIPMSTQQPRDVESPIVSMPLERPVIQDDSLLNHPMNKPQVQPVLHGPRKIKKRTDREYIAVLGEDGQVYWLEVDRTRMIKGPKPAAPQGSAPGDL